ncbi:tensin-4 [Tiliqua scincoides]|uniref:tensin-4 n=1 Tax=Tiliqua scincoides TaxID=71010 RepID=UPI0034635262
MSKVIPNHVLQVGQTICVSSPEEHACFHPSGCSSCHTLPEQYFYYSMEGWNRSNSLPQTGGRSLPKTEIYDSCKPNTEVVSLTSPTMGDKCLQEDPTSTSNYVCPVSPTLDISIENLNNLILEIDPTFQPLQVKPAQSQSPAQAIPPSNMKQASESPDIKYIEMSPARAKCQELSRQSSTSPIGTPLSMSPVNHGHLFLHRGVRGDHCNTNGHVTSLSGGDCRRHQHFLPTGRQSPTCIQVSQSISIPQPDQKNSAAHGSPSRLATSPGFENAAKLSWHGKIQQRISEASVLSTSPGSDTSYILGSNTQSWSNNEPESSQARPMGNHSSAGSLGSSYVDCHSSGSYYPSFTYSQKRNSPLPPPFQKGQTPIGSPLPHANSTCPIPIVLINGCPEQSENSPKQSRAPPGSFKQKMSSSSSGTFSGISSSNKTSSESSLSSSSSLDSCFREAQPTMKFVMDTSKYWFKPSITRDQAVQLLMDETPGAFIMRDSTSYRGCFGLAMKVFNNKTGEDGCDFIRHFLIESSARGVHLKGADEEPYFGSLSAFVYQHTIMPLALPCKLVIPSQDFVGGDENPSVGSDATLPVSKTTAVCNVLYLRSVTMETLTGKAAVRKAVSSTFELETPPTPTAVHFKVTEQGITLTDIQRKIFFRRHYPLASISFCDLDPENRKWQKFSKTSRIFGIVVKSPADSENICHLFAEYDAVHPASHIVDFIKKLLPAA